MLKTEPCRILVLVAAPFMVAALAVAQVQTPQHPLDALKTAEYWTVYEVLQASGRMNADTFYASVLLHAPAKDKVLAWKSSDPVPRMADVILLRKGEVIEARVDIAGRKLESWKEVKGVHAPVIESEFRELGELVKNDPRVREALAKRGIKDLTTVECVPLPYGYFAVPELAGRRIMYGGCSDLHGAYLSWGRSIERLYVQVDAVEKKVLKVIDGGPVPVASGPINFQEAASVARAGTTPLTVMQPNGPGFQISAGEVSWQNWRFRVRLDPRVGAVINLVRFDDGAKLRSVLYEASLSELYVPYMDPAEGWATRMFIDAGEFFHGGVLKQLREGVDCPANATYMDGIAPNERGIPMLRPRLACLYEFSSGNPAWRHFEKEMVWGRPSRTLVVRSAAVIGNYDYLLDWRFEQDGTVRVAVGATGIIETKGVVLKNADATAAHGTNGHATTGSPDEYGQFVAENTVGVNHDHFFSFRLDLDVDGRDNSLMVHRLTQRQLPASTHRKTIWVADPLPARTERDAMMDIHLNRPSMWIFENPNVRGPLGYPTGYEIMAGATAASLLDPDDGPQLVGAFSAHQLWVTPYKPDELYAAGVYPTASKGGDGLAVWTKANRPIENTDIVAWYTLGFHHMPRAEDWPVMPVMWHEFLIRPFHFFPQNPVLTLPGTP
jgi:primary-amine oxidase